MRSLIIDKKITPNDNKVLNIYFSDIRNIEILTIEEEVELMQKIKLGDEKAKEKIIKANQRFVVSVANQYQWTGTPLGDLINEGNIGLIKAIEKYDETRGFKFISYAVWWIRQSILMAIKDYGTIIKNSKNKNFYKIKTFIEKFYIEYGREPNEEEIVNKLEVSINEAKEILLNKGSVFSFDKPFSNEEGSDSLIDIFVGEQEPTDGLAIINGNKKFIFEILSTLNQRESFIITKYFGIDGNQKNLDEISKELGLTSERIRGIKEKTIRKLRHFLKKKLGENFNQ